MGRGPWYTREETKGLIELYIDNPEMRYTELADTAIRYGIVVNRSRDGVADKFSQIANTVQKHISRETQAQMQMPSDELIEMTRQRDYFEEQYIKLRTAIENLYKEISK